MKRWLMLLLVLLMPFAALAQDAPLTVIEAVLADLNARLGTSLTLDMVDNWTWDQEDFNDASLGCPQPDQMYAQVITRGYIITFTQDGTTYDYRTSADGSALFLCDVTQGEATPEATAESGATLIPVGEVISAENAAQLAIIGQIEGSFAAVMDYSPTGNTIAVAGLTVPDSASGDTPAVLVYNANDLTEAPQELLPGAEPVLSMTYVPTSAGASLVTGGMRGTVAIFPVEPQGFDILFMQAPAVVESVVDVAASPDGTVIASVNNALLSSAVAEPGVYLWDASTGEQTLFLPLDSAPMSVAFSPDGLLAVGDVAGTIHLWDLSSIGIPAESATLQGHTDAVRDLQFSPDGGVLASASMDGTARLWSVTGEPEDYRQSAVLESGESVLALDFSPDGLLLVSAGGSSDDEDATNAVSIWSVSDAVSVAGEGELVAVLTGHTDAVGSVAFSPDGTLLASIGGDGVLRLWGLNPGDAAVG